MAGRLTIVVAVVNCVLLPLMFSVFFKISVEDLERRLKFDEFCEKKTKKKHNF
jgi:hypothetical protein